MADDVTLPAQGTGTTTPVVSTEDISGKHWQRVKIGSGVAGSTTMLKVAAEDAAFSDGDTGIVAMAVRQDDPANSSGTDGDYEPLKTKDGKLWVAPLMLPFAAVGEFNRPADTTTYAAGDNISDSTSAPTTGGFTFSGAARKSGAFFVITDVHVVSSANPATRLAGEIVLFNQAVTNINDNSAFVISDAEAKTIQGIIPFSLISMGANNSYAHISGQSILGFCSGTANLRFLMRARNAYVPVSGETFTITIHGFWVS